MSTAMNIKKLWYSLPRFIAQARELSFMSKTMKELSMLQVILVYIFMIRNHIFLCFQNCFEKKCAKAKYLKSENTRALRYVSIIAKIFNLLSLWSKEIQMHVRQGIQTTFVSFSRKMFLPKPNLALFRFFSISSYRFW